MPLGESMISTLKSNKSIMLDKSKRFRKTLGGYGKKENVEYDFPEATPKILKEIRERIQKERKQSLIKSVILSVVIVIILILVIALT